MRPLDIDADQRIGTERPRDDVRADALELVRIDAVLARQLPDMAVVKSQLFDAAVANAVDPAVADVADPGAFGPE